MYTTERLNIAFLSCDNDFGLAGLRVLEHKNLNIVYKNFGKEELKMSHLDVDYLISFCYHRRVSGKNLLLAKKGSINFHPAPLPSYKGFSVYNFGILNDEKEWGTTAHMMEEKFDSGSIIKSNSFLIDNETAHSLREKSRFYLLKLLNEVIDDIIDGREFKIVDNVGGSYYSKKMMNEARVINLDEPEDVIERKIRAFWCPPHSGAVIVIKDREYTLINSNIIKFLGDK